MAPNTALRLVGDRELLPATQYEWYGYIRRIRATGLIAGRTGADGKATKGAVSPTLFKAIALAFGSYADPEGTNVKPGDATIAADMECAIKTVRAVRNALVDLGLMERVSGRTAGFGEVYRLTCPTDLLDSVEVLSPAQLKLAARSIRESARGKRSGGPVDHPEASDLGGSSGPTEASYGGSTGPAHGGSSGPAYQPLTGTPNTTEPTVVDLRAAVTVPRARSRMSQTSISEAMERAARAREAVGVA